MQSPRLKQHTYLKEYYSRCTGQPLKRHDFQVHAMGTKGSHEMQNEDFRGQTNLKWGNRGIPPTGSARPRLKSKFSILGNRQPVMCVMHIISIFYLRNIGSAKQEFKKQRKA